ncbi:MAG TPA: hypothetical protein VIG33_07810 [Pseudobdellovibrionaceae bacterium]|jgi:hypothetical protein
MLARQELKLFRSWAPPSGGARDHFNLKTKDETLHFISMGGVHGLGPDKTVPWKNNPNPQNPVMVDSYNFFAGSDYGYLAFMFQPLTNKWLLKSFKKNDKPDPRNTSIGDAFKKALQLLKEDK